jgi:hypothetical protein
LNSLPFRHGVRVNSVAEGANNIPDLSARLVKAESRLRARLAPSNPCELTKPPTISTNSRPLHYVVPLSHGRRSSSRQFPTAPVRRLECADQQFRRVEESNPDSISCLTREKKPIRRYRDCDTRHIQQSAGELQTRSQAHRSLMEYRLLPQLIPPNSKNYGTCWISYLSSPMTSNVTQHFSSGLSKSYLIVRP